MPPKTDRFMERMHERRMEQQGGGLSARAERRAMEAHQRRQRQRQQIIEEFEEPYSDDPVTGREPESVLSSLERSLRYMQMYSAGPRRMAEMTISNREEPSVPDNERTVEVTISRYMAQSLDADIAQRLGGRYGVGFYGVDLASDPHENMSESEKAHRRERLGIIHRIMDARRLQGHVGSDFEDTVVRLARELVTHEDDFARTEAQKHKRSAVDVRRTLHFGEEDFETGCNEEDQ